jgi:hypothetical protein
MGNLGETDLSTPKPGTKKGGFGHSTQTTIRKHHRVAASAACLWLLLLSPVAANASDFIRAEKPPADQKNTTLTDPCSPLLRATSPAVSDRRTRHSAGDHVAPAAALGLALGLRLVTGPRESLEHRPRDIQTGNLKTTDHSEGRPSPALSIALWRQCKNQIALKDITK